MSKHQLRFRQVHLDFHVSGLIPGIGKNFDKHRWQQKLSDASIDSITCFAVCGHGWNYNRTRVGKMHPHLQFDLLRAQFDACKELDIHVPIYITAGFNQRLAMEHAEWCEIKPDDRTTPPLRPGFIKLCFNTPYLDELCALIGEVARDYPNADGIFLDIIHQSECCCRHCVRDMIAQGLNPESEAERKRFSAQVLRHYYQRATAAARQYNPEMPVFHNSGNVVPGRTGLLPYFSHLELESLPTGGWGYDHYPFAAAYSRNLELDFLGMTGKFHTTWGEFGGFKHPNALRYECCAMLANGSKCSIGDQPHPGLALDDSTYAMIGAAYREVKQKEEFCRDVHSLANLAILSSAGVHAERTGESAPDIGASRLLLEAHIPFDVVDLSMDFARYRFLLLPDDIRLDEALAARLHAFRSHGGKLILSGYSGLDAAGRDFALKLPARYFGINEFCPDYVQCAPEFAPDFVRTPFVMYEPSCRIKVKKALSLGKVFNPYFSRTFEHFCSHQHAPCREKDNGCDAGFIGDGVLYFAHPVFTVYRGYGMVALREFAAGAIKKFMGSELPVRTNLPSAGRVTLMRQEVPKRTVVHLLYANTVLRGGMADLTGTSYPIEKPLEVIEELNDLHDVQVSLPRGNFKKAFLEPEHRELALAREEDMVTFTVPVLNCHRIITLEE